MAGPFRPLGARGIVDYPKYAWAPYGLAEAPTPAGICNTLGIFIASGYVEGR